MVTFRQNVQAGYEAFDYLTPQFVKTRAIPSVNEEKHGRPFTSYSWSAVDRQNWWEWDMAASDATSRYDWSNPPLVFLVGGSPGSSTLHDTYIWIGWQITV